MTLTSTMATVHATVVNTSLGLYQVTLSKDASVVYDVDIYHGYCTCYSGERIAGVVPSDVIQGCFSGV